MRPPSKHGLERKFKPWRKGKSSSDKVGGGSKIKRPTNASLKNRLRGQKRLLAKLQQSNTNGNDGNDNSINNTTNKETMEGVQQSINQLERDIAAYEVREREKKNAAKYHQVKFIERQKLTRLEKSVKRQLQKAQQSSQTSSQHSKLEQQLQSIAMDQLYIAFYPTNRKYMAIFAKGYDRLTYDENGRKRRRAAWDDIRQKLRSEDSNNDAQNDAKAWVFNLDVAKETLLSMPAGAYPNEDDAVMNKPKDKVPKKKDSVAAEVGVASKKKDSAAKKKENAAVVTAPAGSAKSDGRFALSKELDGLFQQSTTGDDYKEELKSKEEPSASDDSSDSDDGSSSDEDDADPLKGFKGKEKEERPSSAPINTTKVDARKGEDDSSSSSSSSAPSSSSEDDSSDSDSDSSSDSSSSDSEEDMAPPNNSHLDQLKSDGNRVKEEEDVEEEEHDDFFASAKVSTEDVFAQAQKNQTRKKNSERYGNDNNDDMPYRKRRPDKSRGFQAQNQSKRQYRDFQARQKRQKFG